MKKRRNASYLNLSFTNNSYEDGEDDNDYFVSGDRAAYIVVASSDEEDDLVI